MNEALYQKLERKAFYHSLKSKKIIREAFDLAERAHRGQKRLSGDDYITHPLSVATMLAERKFDTDTVVAGVLHDVLEDTNVTISEITKKFGDTVAEIIDGLTKISDLKDKKLTLNVAGDEEFIYEVDNYRKMLLATAKDIRVIIVKIYDRVHNSETIEWLPEKRKQFFAKESIEIYAQIAERIGLFEAKNKLENLLFKYGYPEEYKKFLMIKKGLPRLNQKFLDKIIKETKQLLKDNKINFVDIYGRLKHNYSLYQKLTYEYADNIDLIFDLYAFRIIVSSISDCYKVLGVIHSYFEPIPGRIYDMIAKPKGNGYQSIHSIVKDESGQIFEVQIRTRQMHEVAEYGPAAHWHYKDLINSKNEKLIKKNYTEWQNELENLLSKKSQKTFLTDLKYEVFSKKIFVFSPKGEIIKLKQGATPIDFAFQIHTKIGLRSSGAKINGRIAPISTILKNGDIIEIILGKTSKPSIDWLRFVVSAQARQKIKQYFREVNHDQLVAEGSAFLKSHITEFGLEVIDQKTQNKRIAESRLPYNNIDNALIALAEHDLPKISLLKALYPNFDNSQKTTLTHCAGKNNLRSLSGIKHEYAGCCQSKVGDNLIGYVTANHLIKIHNKSCRFIKKANPNRIIDV